MIDVESTIISQYGNSPTLLQLIRNMNVYIDPRADIDQFYFWVWNINTATGFGLDIWGRIIGVDRGILGANSSDDDAYRSLLFLKALSNITATTNPALNQLLRNWIGSRGRVYVNDLGNMLIRYTFEFALQPFEIDIVSDPDIIVRPAGVDVTISFGTYPVFGFAEMGTTWAAPFDQAPFISNA